MNFNYENENEISLKWYQMDCYYMNTDGSMIDKGIVFVIQSVKREQVFSIMQSMKDTFSPDGREVISLADYCEDKISVRLMPKEWKPDKIEENHMMNNLGKRLKKLKKCF